MFWSFRPVVRPTRPAAEISCNHDKSVPPGGATRDGRMTAALRLHGFHKLRTEHSKPTIWLGSTVVSTAHDIQAPSDETRRYHEFRKNTYNPFAGVSSHAGNHRWYACATFTQRPYAPKSQGRIALEPVNVPPLGDAATEPRKHHRLGPRWKFSKSITRACDRPLERGGGIAQFKIHRRSRGPRRTVTSFDDRVSTVWSPRLHEDQRSN